MSIRNTNQHYGSVAKFFHWLIFVLLLIMVPYGFLLEDVPEAYQGLAYNIHKLIGLSILLLVILRLLWAMINVKPLLPGETPYWQQFSARLLHDWLYVVLIAIPLVGWIGSSAANHAPQLGNIALALPVGLNKPLGKAMFQMHYLLVLMLIAFFVVHLLAALYHHFVLRDKVLLSMLPARDERDPFTSN